MRILYLDVDTLRADHLSCYGYCRETTPNLDRLAEGGTRFENCYVSDAPCLPSRASLFTGRFGIHSGVVNHGGTSADLRLMGPERGFFHGANHNSWISAIRDAGYHTVSVSPFAERHAAWWFYRGFREMYDTGKRGMEIAQDVSPVALRWLTQNAKRDNWFLHVNLWDPHTPYRTPLEYGNPFEGKPFDEWLTEEQIRKDFEGYGPHCANDLYGNGPVPDGWPRIPRQITNMDDYVRWIDGYDTGIRYADEHCGMILKELERQGVLDDTTVIMSSDHGENQGEFNIYGDHHTSCHITARVPLIIRRPGLPGGRVDTALHYQTDMAATVLEMIGARVPADWDGVSFAPVFREGRQAGRETLVCGNCAWSCQRSVRWDNWILLRTYHDGLKDLPDVMLFDVAGDPHQTKNLASARPDLVNAGLARLELWTADMMKRSASDVDPMWNVMREGGPFHTRNQLEPYCKRLRETGREHHAEALMRRHGRKL
ncbi:MAG TPA: sulfatase [Candidatus Brocadiia bacterium]|nr:sulfatase [Candidatus Brocadiia bacterium]